MKNQTIQINGSNYVVQQAFVDDLGDPYRFHVVTTPKPKIADLLTDDPCNLLFLVRPTNRATDVVKNLSAVLQHLIMQHQIASKSVLVKVDKNYIEITFESADVCAKEMLMHYATNANANILKRRKRLSKLKAELAELESSQIYPGELMALGICCQWLYAKTKRDGSVEYKNQIAERSLQLGAYKSGKYSDSQITQTYLHNIAEIAAIAPVLKAAGFAHFRLSSNLFPLMDQVPTTLWDNQLVKAALHQLGIALKGFRLSTHPGQYTVLSSDNTEVINSAMSEIEHQSWIFDQLGLDVSPHAAINVHGGKGDRAATLIASIKGLSANAQKRLTLENDESAYSVKDLLAVSAATGTPIVFDSHHHTFNPDGLTGEEASQLAIETWPAWIKPIQHLSNTEPGLESGSFVDRRKHSWGLHYIPDYQKAQYLAGLVDIEMEFKGKNLGILPKLSELGLNLT